MAAMMMYIGMVRFISCREFGIPVLLEIVYLERGIDKIPAIIQDTFYPKEP